MKWVRFLHDGEPCFGRIDGDQVRRHRGDLFGANEETGEVFALAGLSWLPPCAPGKVIALWNNFRALADKNGWTPPAEPLWFLKSPGSVTGPHQPIPAPPAEVGRVTYEGELAIVIGRRARAVKPEDAASHVFGYTCGNDVTALEVLNRDPGFVQWTRAKSFDGFCPLGPSIETAFDPTGAHVLTRVGGRERQNYPLADMFFGPLELVSRISQDLTLEPGDVILCGTSLGVLPMKPGTMVEVEIAGIGTLANLFA